MDEGQNGACVPQDECTCFHHGKIFFANEIIKGFGKKCQCKNGGWICNSQPTASRTCSVVGLSHVETFDGALLTVKPGDYLLVQNLDNTTQHVRIEASVKRNFKRELKFTYGINTVVLSDMNSIMFNDKMLKQLPFQTADMTIRQATSQFILIESKEMHIAYDGNAVYLTLESFYRERIRGLCGSFDYNKKNDLRLPNGKLTHNTNVFSEAYFINGTSPSSSSEEDIPKDFNQERSEKYCHRIRDNVCKFGAPVHGLILSCIKDQRVTRINMDIRAYCYWHSAFAHACALIGYDIAKKYTQWRGGCESVLGQCSVGTTYEECPFTCLKTCSDPDGEHEHNSVCRQQCLAGCVCIKDHYHDTNQSRHKPLKCSKESDCSCYDEQTKLYHQPGSIVKRGQCSTCMCLRGQLNCNSGKCTESKIRCPNNLIFTETSLTLCPQTCSNHLLWKNCHKYRSGCDCPENMIRDENTNRCVYPKHCTCNFNNGVFPYGSKITQDCNECTCVSGQWTCTRVDCSRTCSILRNTHYTTFSQQYLKVNSGSCEYIAARFKHHAKKFSLVLNNHASTEHHHSLQTHLTISGTIIYLESGKPVQINNTALMALTSSPIHYPAFTIYKAGLFVIINGTNFIVRWDHDNRIYLTISGKWKGHLEGLCTKHDRPSKAFIIQKEKYTNVWKVNSKCEVESRKPKDDEEKSRWAHEICVHILNGTASTKNPFFPCLDKFSQERRTTLYDQCMEETCSCAVDSHECPALCSWFASLSELCRKEDHSIEYWRNDEFCPLTCEENEEYQSCGTLCQKTCKDLVSTTTMKCYNDTCNEGCYCKEGYVLNENGDCIQSSECSGKTPEGSKSTVQASRESKKPSATEKQSDFTGEF
ncbi:unnamed protein product [Rotaria socialis]|nr:unnamed protein product [Rotaria socialis]CAF3425441.1 unnamed protein product [Rotaria socialis]